MYYPGFSDAFSFFVRYTKSSLWVPCPFAHVFTCAFLQAFLISLCILCGFPGAFGHPYITSCVPICVPRVFRYMPPLYAPTGSQWFPSYVPHAFAVCSLMVVTTARSLVFSMRSLCMFFVRHVRSLAIRNPMRSPIDFWLVPCDVYHEFALVFPVLFLVVG